MSITKPRKRRSSGIRRSPSRRRTDSLRRTTVRLHRYLLRMSDADVLGLLVTTRDEPGVLYRVSEAIFKHGANITYVAGGAHREHTAELQLEVTGARDEGRLVADLENL